MRNIVSADLVDIKEGIKGLIMFKKILIGILIALVIALIGFFIYALVVAQENGITLPQQLQQWFSGNNAGPISSTLASIKLIA